MEFGIYGFVRYLVWQGKYVHAAKALSRMRRGISGHALKEDKP
jgi:hypothetical protein